MNEIELELQIDNQEFGSQKLEYKRLRRQVLNRSGIIKYNYRLSYNFGKGGEANSQTYNQS